MQRGTTLLELLFSFVADPDLRRRVLDMEVDALEQFDLLARQSALAREMHEEEILDELIREMQTHPGGARELLRTALRSSGLDLKPAHDETWKDHRGEPSPGTHLSTFAVNAYSQGGIHIRQVSPTKVRVGVPTRLMIRGQGFTRGMKIRAQLAGQRPIDCTILESSCDIDVSQRVVFELTLPVAGGWTLEATDPGKRGDVAALMAIP